jgi:hypothetical protein
MSSPSTLKTDDVPEKRFNLSVLLATKITASKKMRMISASGPVGAEIGCVHTLRYMPLCHFIEWILSGTKR